MKSRYATPLHVGGIDVISCHHLELIFAHLFQKHLEWLVDWTFSLQTRKCAKTHDVCRQNGHQDGIMWRGRSTSQKSLKPRTYIDG